MRASRCWQWTFAGGILFVLAAPVSANIIFTTLPLNGNVSGPAGSLVGWGYSIANTDPSNWFVSTDLNSDSFSNGTPTLLFDFPDLAPGFTATEAFDPVNAIGLFELQWNPSAPTGSTNSGNFVLSGQWWDGDPLNGGIFIADALDSSAAYTATVSGSSSSTPEPSSLWPMAMILAVLVLFRKTFIALYPPGSSQTMTPAAARSISLTHLTGDAPFVVVRSLER